MNFNLSYSVLNESSFCFGPIIHFYIPCKCQKTEVCGRFPGVKKSNIGLIFDNGFNMWPMKALNYFKKERN